MHVKRPACFLLPVLFSLVSSFQAPSTRLTVSSLLRTFLRARDNEDETYLDDAVDDPADASRRALWTNVAGAGLVLASSIVAGTQLYRETLYTPPGFRRLPVTQFLAALGDPASSSGGPGATAAWGLWRVDPGPRGVRLADFERDLVATGGVAPTGGWRFDPQAWWLEEHGLIMEAPAAPVAPGRYLVTGFRELVTGLTVGKDGSWRLDEGTLDDVTHRPCRAARYTPLETIGETNELGTPRAARPADFPVPPGAAMPDVPGCRRQDYAVLFVVGVADGAAAAGNA